MLAKETTADDNKYCKSCKENPKNNNSDITLTSTEFNVIKKKTYEPLNFWNQNYLVKGQKKEKERICS